MEAAALAASHGCHGSRLRHLEKCLVTAKRKKQGMPRRKAHAPSRPLRFTSAAPSAAPPAADDDRFVFKFSFGDVPGEPVGCVIDVVALTPGAALARARAVVDSMQSGVSVGEQARWPAHDIIDENARCEEYARVYFGSPSALTLKHLTMISELSGPYVDVNPGELTPTTNVRELLSRRLSDARHRW